MPEDTELEAYWDELKQARLVELSGSVGDFRDSLRDAAAKTAADLQLQFFKELVGRQVGSEEIGRLVATAVELFLKNWYEDLRHRDPASLVEVVLAGHTIPVEELKGFVRALPLSLVERIVKQGGLSDSGSGIHALLAVEWHHRQQKGVDYQLHRDPMDSKLVVTTFPAKLGGRPLTFRLDEKFEIQSESGVDPSRN